MIASHPARQADRLRCRGDPPSPRMHAAVDGDGSGVGWCAEARPPVRGCDADVRVAHCAVVRRRRRRAPLLAPLLAALHGCTPPPPPPPPPSPSPSRSPSPSLLFCPFLSFPSPPFSRMLSTGLGSLSLHALDEGIEARALHPPHDRVEGIHLRPPSLLLALHRAEPLHLHLPAGQFGVLHPLRGCSNHRPESIRTNTTNISNKREEERGRGREGGRERGRERGGGGDGKKGRC